MGIASFVIGILSGSGVCLSLVPLLNVLNCVSLPLASVGFVLGLWNSCGLTHRTKAAPWPLSG